MGKILLIVGNILLIIGIGWLVAGIGCFVAVAPFAYLFNSFGPAIMKGANPFGMAVAIWLSIAFALGWIVFLTIGVSRLLKQH
jgi:hypothetical protein